MEHQTNHVVEITELTKTYGGYRAVDGVSLTVQPGEIFGLLGTNGAGKTTTVECAQGLRRPDSGTVKILGFDPIADRARLAGRVGSQLQDSQLPDHMRVGEALRLFADLPGAFDAAVDQWDLQPIITTPFAKLSGGQRQRLFLALALLNRPEVVFLDELTQGLDPSARRSVWRLIEQVRSRGTTVVLVTHFLEEAEVLCDRVAVMRDGRLLDIGTPAELIDRHSDGVRMRFGAPAEAIEWLPSLPHVSGVRALEGEIEATGTSAAVAHIGAALVARDLAPSSFRIHQPTLEDALLELIDPIGD